MTGASKPKTTTDALRQRAGARRKLAVADALAASDPTGARWHRLEAAEMDANAVAFLNLAAHYKRGPQVGNGGEMVPVGESCDALPGLVETVRQNPSLVTASASTKRLELAADAGALDMAVDAAETLRARSSLEKMLAHQLATSHALAMTFAAKAQHFAGHVASWNSAPRQQAQSQEAARMAQASARMMQTFQQGLLTLQQVRGGPSLRAGSVRQHVEVRTGGKAVVTGSVSAALNGVDRLCRE